MFIRSNKKIGYHIYLPVNAPVLEELDIFAKFKSPSRRLMQYAESILSNKKADFHPVTTNVGAFTIGVVVSPVIR